MNNVAVVGGGAVALLAAIAIARALPTARVTLVRVPVPPDALADHAHVTLPALRRLHERLGIDERGMIARAGASHLLATRHHGWDGAEGEWLIGHGAAPDPSRDAIGPGQTGVAAALALAGRFVPPVDDAASPLSDIDYALRFAPGAYRRRLASLAAHVGVAMVDAAGVAVTHGEDGGVTALIPDGGASIAADLFVDATGPAASLIADRTRIDWHAAIPVRRVATELAAPAIALLDEVMADGGRVTLRSPGRDATRIVTLSDDGAGVPIAPGRLARAWQGNVVAIGDAAQVVPPLGWTNLYQAAVAIELLLALLPGRVIHPLERAEWNRRWARGADSARDYVAAHFVGLTGFAGMVAPETLAHRIAQFARRSRLPAQEEDMIARDLWTQVLTGIGIVPGPVPRMAAVPAAVRADALAAHRRRLDAAVAAAEPYPAWLAHMIGGGR